jgi:hypothetical protein
MTREPFIAHSELTNEIYIVVGKEKYRVTEQAIKAVMAIKVLEQESILDKIKSEIMAIGNWNTKSELPNGDLEKVLDIIDKYKAESEDKE